MKNCDCSNCDKVNECSGLREVNYIWSDEVNNYCLAIKKRNKWVIKKPIEVLDKQNMDSGSKFYTEMLEGLNKGKNKKNSKNKKTR